jgi:uncharacterized SAM-binding protein YcdF (DUF218 family)
LQGRYILADGPLMPEPVNPAWRRWRLRGVRIGLSALVALGLVLAHRPILVGFAHLFRVDNPAPSDALVVLLGGLPHRPLKAAELYQSGLAPVVLIGESLVDPRVGLSETSLSQQVLIKNLVPAHAIHVLPGGMVTSTRDEAMRVRDYIGAHPEIKRITVVTSAYHSARAHWIFTRVLRGTGVDVRLSAAPERGLDETDWYTHDEGLVIYFGEAIKALYYRLAY